MKNIANKNSLTIRWGILCLKTFCHMSELERYAADCIADNMKCLLMSPGGNARADWFLFERFERMISLESCKAFPAALGKKYVTRTVRHFHSVSKQLLI